MPIDKPKTSGAVLVTPPDSMPDWRHSLTNRIPLHGKHGRGNFALVDDEDYGRLAGYNWLGCFGGKGGAMYVARTIRPKHVKRGSRLVSMHREVMGVVNAGRQVQVDHINGDTLDNRKANLRLCTGSQNRQNQHARYGSSKFKGVYRSNERPGKCWFAQIWVRGYPRFLGLFAKEEDAGRAYDFIALAHFGQFANLNFPEDAERTRRQGPPRTSRNTQGELGRRLKELRREHGMTQETLAYWSGLCQTTISLIETQKREPQVETWRALVEVFGDELDAKTFVNKERGDNGGAAA